MHSTTALGSSKRSAHFIRPNTTNPFLAEVLEGLSKEQKQIPSKYFYDEKGSQLFDEICELEEYYPTRTEISIMERDIEEMVRMIGMEALLVEYGSGSSLKTRILLENLVDMAGYVPIDISKEHLLDSARKLQGTFPDLEILPVHADYSTEVKLPVSQKPAKRKVVYFPGSTIGNFTPDEAVLFLKRVTQITEKGGGLLIGVDMKKDVSVLEAAYNDARGVTAEFNLNLLSRINKELDADFDVNQFEHKAIYNKEAGRIEMHLFSKIEQTVQLGAESFFFNAGESIHTENSYKYTLEEFAQISASAGLRVKKVWTDPNCYFSVQLLTVL